MTTHALSAAHRDEWLCGYAAALAAVQRLHDQPSIVASVVRSDGLCVDSFVNAGVEDFDLRELRAALRVGEDGGR